MYSVYEALPDQLKERIADMKIKHDGTYNSGGYLRQGVTATDDPRASPGAIHPLVCTHPDTGRRMLYLGRRRNAYLMGLELKESEALLDESLADEVHVVTDAEIALADAFGEEAGIVLIAGTGSIAHGRGPAGALERVGGWGPFIGDEGGGYWIARRALSVVTAATDGREPDTSLVGAILTAAELDEVESLIPWAASASVSQIASLAPVVVASAEAGDLRANALLGLAAEELVLHVRTLARSLFEDERAAVQVALGGGLLDPGSALRRRVEHRLKSAVPGSKVHSAPIVAVRGAVRRAMQMGVELGAS